MSGSLTPKGAYPRTSNFFDAIDRVMACVREGCGIHDLLQVAIDTVSKSPENRSGRHLSVFV